MPDSLFLIKLQATSATLFKKEPQAQLFSCEFFEISENTFSYRTAPVAACDFWNRFCEWFQ